MRISVRTGRRLAVAACATALAASATACGGGSSGGGSGAAGSGGSADEIVLQTNWTTGGQENKPLTKALADFTAQTGIKVKVLENGDDLNQVYETSLLAGKEADVLLVGLLEKQLDWVKNGAVQPVGDYLSQWGLTDKIPASAITDWTDSDGKLRGFPYAGFTWPWWYNKALFDKNGITIPTTVDELVDAAKKLRAAGVGPVAIGGNDWSGQKIFLQIMESYMPAEEAKKVFAQGGTCSNADAMKGIDLFTKLRDAGVFVDGVEGLSADQATALYMSGKAAVAPMGSWSYLSTDASVLPTTMLGGLPTVPGGPYTKPTAYEGSTSAGWWISPNGAKKSDAVKKLIQFMYQPAVLKAMVTDGGVVPPVGTQVDTSAVSNPLLAASVSDLPKNVDWAVMPDLYVPADVGNPMYHATSTAFTKGNDSKAICAAVDQVYQAAK
ncbi:ABC transporter substrate-binding protein [Catenulispora yoronensis]|uniref:ABC transporter substrate-binding protein n=1 Tax=Catenulispora yoronensis TaxID=450799 RepID=A0ABN2U0L6_9ACTN